MPGPTITYSTAGSHSFDWPDGAKRALVQVWGAGAGGGTSTDDYGAAGGGGGGYSREMVYRADGIDMLEVYVGEGGGAGEDGEETYVEQDGERVARAPGGSAPDGFIGGASGTGIAVDVNQTIHSGGPGGSNDPQVTMFFTIPSQPGGAGGGAGAGQNIDGKPGGRPFETSPGNGGAAAMKGGAGGRGGKGVTDTPAEDGEDGEEPGAGGGGGGQGKSSGSGAPGMVKITSPPPRESGSDCCCAPPISCDDETLAECVDGKTPIIKVVGAINGFCENCSIANDDFICDELVGDPGTCFYGGCAGKVEPPCTEIFTSDLAVNASLSFGRASGGGAAEILVTLSAYYDFSVSFQLRPVVAQFLSTSTDDLQRLCSGQSVELPLWKYFGATSSSPSGYCRHPFFVGMAEDTPNNPFLACGLDATVTVRLV